MMLQNQPKGSDLIIEQKNNDLHICFSTDDNYACYCGTAIASILLNANADEVIHFYIIDGGISEKNRKRLEELKKIKDCNIYFTKIEPSEFIDCPLPNGSHSSLAAYYRIKIPYIFPYLEKVLYLDCDLIAMSSLKSLFNTDVYGLFGAAKENVYGEEDKKRLNLKDYPYFNDGVLLINCRKWRDEQMEAQLFKWIRDHRELIKLCEQDAMNVVMAGKISILADKFNVFEKEYDKWNYQEEPIIIHYTGKIKPWNPFTKRASLKYFFNIQKRTQWNQTKWYFFFRKLPKISSYLAYEKSKRLLLRISPDIFHIVKNIYLKQKYG